MMRGPRSKAVYSASIVTETVSDPISFPFFYGIRWITAGSMCLRSRDPVRAIMPRSSTCHLPQGFSHGHRAARQIRLHQRPSDTDQISPERLEGIIAVRNVFFSAVETDSFPFEWFALYSLLLRKKAPVRNGPGPSIKDTKAYRISVILRNRLTSVLARVDIVLMKMSSATPTTSLRVSPTVSPVTAAL